MHVGTRAHRVKCQGEIGNRGLVEGVADLGLGQRDARHAGVISDMKRSRGHASSFALTGDYMRNTPKRVSSMGALRVAASPRASTRRVSAGSITPSSHRRAVA
ncbi:hypothetical protein D3C80_1535740 [compost metagenome]